MAAFGLEGEAWAVGTVLLPIGGAVCAFLVPRAARGVVWAVTLVVPLLVLGVTAQVLRHGPLGYRLGGWNAPLGIGWHADGLTVLLLLLAAVAGAAATVHALGAHPPAPTLDERGQQGAREHFWPLWLFAWSALNALFLSADAFNVYVTLELLGLAAVGLVAQGATRAAVAAATRYLVVNLLASLLYLLGVALLYATYATLDLASLARVVQPGVPSATAAALVTTGLLLKTAVFPLHFWLPAAHGEAPAPVSALLSGLVVKASFYLLLRFWTGAFASVAPALAGVTLGALGTGAILWGSVQALVQERLKLLVAYSTVAQVGYLLLVFPLTAGGGTPAGAAWTGGVILALSHGLAKAGMFLAAGTLLASAGHDRVADLGDALRRQPLAVFAFAVAAASLTGLPPSGGFVGKWLLLQAALESGQWWWTLPLAVGGLLTAAYTLRVLSRAFSPQALAALPARLPRAVQWPALCLALGAVLLGLATPLVGELAAGTSGVPMPALTQVLP